MDSVGAPGIALGLVAALVGVGCSAGGRSGSSTPGGFRRRLRRSRLWRWRARQSTGGRRAPTRVCSSWLSTVGWWRWPSTYRPGWCGRPTGGRPGVVRGCPAGSRRGVTSLWPLGATPSSSCRIGREFVPLDLYRRRGELHRCPHRREPGVCTHRAHRGGRRGPAAGRAGGPADAAVWGTGPLALERRRRELGGRTPRGGACGRCFGRAGRAARSASAGAALVREAPTPCPRRVRRRRPLVARDRGSGRVALIRTTGPHGGRRRSPVSKRLRRRFPGRRRHVERARTDRGRHELGRVHRGVSGQRRRRDRWGAGLATSGAAGQSRSAPPTMAPRGNRPMSPRCGAPVRVPTPGCRSSFESGTSSTARGAAASNGRKSGWSAPSTKAGPGPCLRQRARPLGPSRRIVRIDVDHAVALLARGKARTIAWLGGH